MGPECTATNGCSCLNEHGCLRAPPGASGVLPTRLERPCSRASFRLQGTSALIRIRFRRDDGQVLAEPPFVFGGGSGTDMCSSPRFVLGAHTADVFRLPHDGATVVAKR